MKIERFSIDCLFASVQEFVLKLGQNTNFEVLFPVAWKNRIKSFRWKFERRETLTGHYNVTDRSTSDHFLDKYAIVVGILKF